MAGALRPNVEKVCKAVYPDHPDAVDARLVRNIVRDSKDPGGYSVVAAGAKLPTPITKNELLHEFAKPVLVAQVSFALVLGLFSTYIRSLLSLD
jgi:hypothetical protein